MYECIRKRIIEDLRLVLREYSRVRHVTLYTVFVYGYSQFDTLPLLCTLVTRNVTAAPAIAIRGETKSSLYKYSAGRCTQTTGAGQPEYEPISATEALYLYIPAAETLRK